MDLPFLVVGDEEGNIFEIEDYFMTGASLGVPRLPREEEIIQLPYGSNLFLLPGRKAVGYDRKRKEIRVVKEYRGRPVTAAAAFMAPAYLQYLGAAFESDPGAETLPLYSYTALGWRNGSFQVPAVRIDPDTRQDLVNMKERTIEGGAKRLLKRYPGNRLIRHLVDNCIRRYCCPAARNLALNRWEAPVPTSPYCNARCLGCLSFQPEESGIPSSQNRLNFVPKPEEVVEFTLPHLEDAPRAVISFGQGCEGEPLLVGDLLAEVILSLRKKTNRGIVNLNTNASLPEIVERLCRAGLDSIRVSINSAQGEFYTAYYNPQGYTFTQVLESMKIAREHGLWISLNYFMVPGFTDWEEEYAALSSLITRYKVDMIQTRNFNYDPEIYPRQIGLPDRGSSKTLGLYQWVRRIREEHPGILLGYFNPSRERMEEIRD